jgi:hypothetical protein
VRVEEVVCDSFINNEVVPSVSWCSVIHETDSEFGDVKVINGQNNNSSLPSNKIESSKLAHLSEQQC